MSDWKKPRMYSRYTQGKVPYREFRFWSPILGCEAARLSIADANGQEYFAIVSRETPRLYREVREEALDAIEAAIEGGVQPGEVTVST